VKALESGSSGKETLEQLLLSRNKKLSNELTLLRVSHQDLQGRLETIQEELSVTNMELEKSRILCATLEGDLERVQDEAANNFPSSAMSVAGTYTSRYPQSSYKSVRGARSTSPTSSIISGFDPNHGSGTLDSLRQAEGAGGGGSGILPMITAQRDRFKKKNNELETELQKSYQSIQLLRSEVASLQKDNLNLYEKTRYVSSYSRAAPSGGAAAAAASSNPTTIQIDDANSAEPTFTRYRSAYESNMSPFSAFRSRESARAFRRLRLPERAVFQLARTVLATRARRNMFAIYCFVLHVLVLMTLFGSEKHGIDATGSIKTATAAGPLEAAAAADVKVG
jgi:homeobox protein cut-like